METTFFLKKDELNDFLCNNKINGVIEESGEEEFSIGIDKEKAKEILLKEFESFKACYKFKSEADYQRERSLFIEAMEWSNLVFASLDIPHQFIFNRTEHKISQLSQEEKEELINSSDFLMILEEQDVIIMRNDNFL